MVQVLLRYYENALTSSCTGVTSDTLIYSCPLNGSKKTSTGHSFWLQRACLTLHIMNLISRLCDRQDCLILRFWVPQKSQRPQFITPHWYSAFRFQPARFGWEPSRLFPSPSPRPSQARPRCILYYADHCIVLASSGYGMSNIQNELPPAQLLMTEVIEIPTYRNLLASNGVGYPRHSNGWRTITETEVWYLRLRYSDLR